MLFYKSSFYYTDTDSLYIHKKHWSDLVDNGFVGKSLGSGKNENGNSGIFYAWFLAPKIKYCILVDDYCVLSAKRTFEGYSEEQRIRKLNDYISLSKRKTNFGRFSIDWTKTIDWNKLNEYKYRKRNKIVQIVISGKFQVIVL